MSTTSYYVATKPDGTDFRNGSSLDYATALEDGKTIIVLDPKGPWRVRIPQEAASGSENAWPVQVGIAPTDVLADWPCRLFRVEGTTITDNHMWGEYKLDSVRVLEEMDPKRVLGPQADGLIAMFEDAARITGAGAERLAAASAPYRRLGSLQSAEWGNVHHAARESSRNGALTCAMNHISDVVTRASQAALPGDGWAGNVEDAREAAMSAAAALVVRDLISRDVFDTMIGAWTTGRSQAPLH